MEEETFFLIPLNTNFYFLLFSVVTFTVLRIHQKPEFVNFGHLELFEENPSSNVNCTKILQGDVDEIQKVKLESLTVKFKKRTLWTNDDYINTSGDCASSSRSYKHIRGRTT